MKFLPPWRYRLTVRTEPSQGLNTGSIPVSATKLSFFFNSLHGRKNTAVRKLKNRRECFGLPLARQRIRDGARVIKFFHNKRVRTTSFGNSDEGRAELNRLTGR